MNLITARYGTPHVTPANDALIHQAFTQDDTCVFPVLEQMAAEVVTNNSIKIRSGLAMLQGYIFSVDPGTYDEVTIQNGNQGENRIDLIVARYTANTSLQTQSMEWVVIQGTPTTGQPVAPSPLTGDIDSGDTPVDMPMFQVLIEGITITSVTTVFESYAAYELDPNRTIPSNADLNDYTEFGCWVCQSNSVTVTLENCPITGSGFALRVSRPTGGAYRLQELLQYNGNRYYRYYNGSSWSNWRCNLYTTDVNNVSDLPGKLYRVNFSRTSVPAKTTYDIATLQVPAGTYVITGNSEWGTDSTTYITAQITSSNLGMLVINRGTMNGGGGLTPVTIVSLDQEDTLTFRVYWGSGSNSGSIYHNAGEFSALRIR